ncbi:MAG: helix-turn-helix transcriptional regulator [Eubacteriales bacterium]|nr:helix-turn-helix transcriptional regulator [Eubacteriales bacterium]
MIDYPDLGKRIRTARLKKGITQEQLANMIDVGVTHISHIETGATIPSMKTFVGIVNALDCSADELLCRDIKTARPFFSSWLSELVSDCTEREAKIIADTVEALKASMRRNRQKD